jgi:aryl-alcohol dehydrogenase-like predicted oxidoreductase/predicted kinase
VAWLDADELRVGLGCMRLSTDESRDEERALATVAAAAAAGVTVFDTARAYGLDEHELGHNERLLARALRSCGAGGRARVVTKGGMTRVGGGWVADGRAKAVRADCEASLDALDGLPIDLYLLHAPDPSTPWATSVRALARLVDDGLVRRVGVSNVDRRRLDEAVELAPVAAVQAGLSIFDERALRGGVVERCAGLGVTFIAHSPLGGPRRAARLARDDAERALAWLLALDPHVVAIPGATRPETARSSAAAAALSLDEDELAAIAPARRRARGPAREGEVVLVMGIPGAGKTRLAEEYVARGYVRLNRDERAGSLRELAEALDAALAGGASRVVLDNTYLDRASRSYVAEAAEQHGLAARCVWLDTPLAQAQVNLVERLLDRFGALPTPEELKAAREPGLLAPTSQMRAVRELEPPAEDEGFAVERVEFARAARGGRPGVLVAAAAVDAELDADPRSPHLVFDWRPGAGPEALAGEVARLAARVPGPVTAAVCPHGGGPPTCWCRPPLPGLALAFARTHGVDLTRSVVVGASAAHRTLARALGARYVET